MSCALAEHFNPPPTYPFSSVRTIVRDAESDFGGSRASACLESHETCKVTLTTFSPRRFLEISLPDRSYRLSGFLTRQSLGVRLVERTNPNVSTNYAPLTYCWGLNTKGIVTTIKSNLKAHYSNINVATLPQTIQDAILVCSGL